MKKYIIIILCLFFMCSCSNTQTNEPVNKTFTLGYSVKNLSTEYNYGSKAFGDENNVVIVGNATKGYKIIAPVGTKYFEENNVLNNFSFQDEDTQITVSNTSVRTDDVITTEEAKTGNIEIKARNSGKEGIAKIDYEIIPYKSGVTTINTDCFKYKLFGKYAYEGGYLKVEVKMYPTDLASYIVFNNATATSYSSGDGRISLKYKNEDGYQNAPVDELAAENKATNALRLFYTKNPKIKQTTYLYFPIKGKITDEAFIAFQENEDSQVYSFYKLK